MDLVLKGDGQARSGIMIPDFEMGRTMRESDLASGDAAAAASIATVQESFEREISSRGEVFEFDVKATAEDAKVLLSK